MENDYIVDFTPYLEDLIEYKTYKRLKPHEILFDAYTSLLSIRGACT